MKALVLALAVLALPAAAQEKKAPTKKPAAAKKLPPAKAHTKPTPEQLMRFQDLEKKQQVK